MTAPIKLDLDVIESAATVAKAANPGVWYSAVPEGPTTNPTGSAILVGPRRADLDHMVAYAKEDADHIAAACPAVVLELIRRLRAAEALAASRIETIPVETQVLAIFTELRADLLDEAREFTEAIQARCGPRTLVAFFQEGASIEALGEEQMRQAGWVLAEQRDQLLAGLEEITAELSKYENTSHPEGHDGARDYLVKIMNARAAIAKAKGGGA